MNTYKDKIINLIKKYKNFLAAAGLILTLILIGVISQFTYDALFYSDSSYASDFSYDNCNVLGIELRGDIHTYVPLDYEGNKLSGWEDTTTSEDVLYLLQEAENSPDIRAILIEVDSYGGSPAAAEEIANTIASMNKPVISFIRDMGVSAAYWSIVPSDYIFALKTSTIGSIGVTQSYIDNVEQNKSQGLTYVELTTGKFKDSGIPDRPLKQEEKDLFMRDLKIIHELFIETIATHRGIALEQVRLIADGSTVLGEQAKYLGLIDEIGGYRSTVEYIENLIGEGAEVCW